MANIFEYIQDFFFSLFIRDPQESEKRRRLRALGEELKHMGLDYYRRSSGQLSPGFGVSVLNLVLVLRPLHEVFTKTIDNQDTRLAQRYKDYLVTARLPEELQELHSSFSYSNLNQRVFESADPDAELAAISGEFEQLLGSLSSSEFSGFESSYTEMNRLVSLCRHDLMPLLRLFDPALKSPDSADATLFQPVTGEDALQELLDLYFVLAGVNFSQNLERNIGLLLQRLSREKAEQTRDRLKKVLQRLQKLCTQSLPPEALLHLLRLIQTDPHFVPQSIQEESSFLEAYKNRLQISYQRSRERIRHQLRELAVAEDLKRLFPRGLTETIAGYREDIDQALQERDFDCFLYIRPLRIIKNYIYLHFNSELREPLKRLIVEGKFSNKVFENMFTRPFYQCIDMESKIIQFEEQLQGDSARSVGKLPKYIELLDQGKAVHNMVNTVLEAIDKDSRYLLEEGANCFYNLFVNVLDILNDAKLKNPTKVTNIKYITAGKPQEFLNRITQGHNKLYLFTKIMKNFTTIKQVTMEE